MLLLTSVQSDLDKMAILEVKMAFSVCKMAMFGVNHKWRLVYIRTTEYKALEYKVGPNASS